MSEEDLKMFVNALDDILEKKKKISLEIVEVLIKDCEGKILEQTAAEELSKYFIQFVKHVQYRMKNLK